MAEIRADLCGFSTEELERTVSAHPNLIVTCRVENTSPATAQERLTAAIRKGARYVDVEIEAPAPLLEHVRAYAKENGCRLILSWHDFTGTPSCETLEGIVRACLAKGADLVKIVTTAHHIGDAVRTLQLYDLPLPVPLVAFAMGAPGQFTRRLCLEKGAPYTYVSATGSGATASGQYTRAEMEALLDPGRYPHRVPARGFGLESVTIPCSKSIAQRAILAAALAEGETLLHNYQPCNDTAAAVEAVCKMGCEVRTEGDRLYIRSRGAGLLHGCRRIETGESGLLTRLLIPLAARISGLNGNIPVEIAGRGSILNRNLHEAAEALQQAGAECQTRDNGYLPFLIRGGIRRNPIRISGKGSSQTVSGFLMTLPLLEAGPGEEATALTVTEPASLPYLELTLRTLRRFGIRIQKRQTPRRVAETPSANASAAGENAVPTAPGERISETARLDFTIPAGQRYRPAELYLDADWSSAAYFAVAGAIAGLYPAPRPDCSGYPGITLRNMPLESGQADEKILEILRSCGAVIRTAPADGSDRNLYDVSVSARRLKAFHTDATHCPDLFPILTVLASHCEGTSSIKGVNRLMHKESNRAETLFAEFTLMGAKIGIEDDLMTIAGSPLHGNRLCSHNDHRIAMSLIIAGLFTDSPVQLDDIRCIDKSFPSFLNLLSLSL